MVKIIFFDIDGTLVSFRTHQIPPSTIEAVHRVRQKGVKVWIATGRPLPFIDNLGGLEYDGIMSVNGAHCQTVNGTVIYSAPLNEDDVRRMVNEQVRSGLTVAYAGNRRAILCAPKGLSPEANKVFSLLHIPDLPLFPPKEALTFEVMQVTAFFTEDDNAHLMHRVLTQCDAKRWHPYFADCIAKGNNKATGIDHIIDYYGIALPDTMAFGDGGNDIEMLRHAGIGVAMGNANDEVKAAADRVTTDVDEDGIAHILNTL